MGKSANQSAIKAKNKKLKIRGIPRRALTAYNLFFAIQRKKILDEQQLNTQDKNDGHANVGFANLANSVARQWKNVDPDFKAELEVKAQKDKIRYQNEMKDWKMRQKMEADLETIKVDLEMTETELKKRSDVGEALFKITAMKKELEQLKQMTNQTKSPEKKDKKTETFPDAESKMDDQIEIECTKHAAEDLDEASPAVGRIAMDLNARGNKIEGTKKELVHMSKEDEDIGFQGF